jgi:hypothetical protein
LLEAPIWGGSVSLFWLVIRMMKRPDQDRASIAISWGLEVGTGREGDKGCHNKVPQLGGFK